MGLYGKLGFGWLTIVAFLSLTAASTATEGIASWVLISLSAVVLLYAVVSCLRWNWPGWHRIHHRAMLAYAMIAGAEAGTAKRESREFDMSAACAHLADVLGLSDPEAVRASCASPTASGLYLSHLVEKRFGDVAAQFRENSGPEIVSVVARMKPGPHFVIARAVESRYGELEAVKYVIACLRGEAK